ncbi:hypothetical protein [Streptomyces sp. S465]|nr:hypothetical protein [Streptomyces sp. S465]WAP60570.1 hypothetical protein N6H00_39480 [Streptomyces sp. S465]
MTGQAADPVVIVYFTGSLASDTFGPVMRLAAGTRITRCTARRAHSG